MVDRLAAVSAGVHDEPVAIGGDSLAPREFRAGGEDLADEIVVFGADLSHRGDVLSR
jgi:hypothetical protein